MRCIIINSSTINQPKESTMNTATITNDSNGSTEQKSALMQQRLRDLMVTHKLKGRHVAELTHRAHVTVRQYCCGLRDTPEHFIELLEFKIAAANEARKNAARNR